MSGRLAVPPVAAPDVSVVVVLYNAWEWSERALRALVANTPPRYELIVVDNGSSDGTEAGLAAITGAAVIRNADNKGFGPAVNMAAQVARGRHLVLLNSDALVEPGWLEPLLSVADADPGVAAVGSRLLNLDGTLQEAGALVWRDGLVNNYGDGDRPDRPEYSFVRDVDYASAACLLVRRSAFEELGGFDPVYAPAYLEDVDLCFALRARGMRIVYQPFSTAVHVRWASGDRSATETLVRRNLPVFRDRWDAELARRPAFAGWPDRRFALECRDALCLDRVLVVCEEVPPLGDAEGRRLDDSLVERLDLLRPVRFTIAVLGGAAPEPASETLRAAGIEVAWGPRDWDAWLSLRRNHYTRVVACSARSADALATPLRQYQSSALVERL